MTDQLTKSQELIARRKAAVPNGVGMFNYATATKASGAIIIDEDGRELIDFAGGIGVVNAGPLPTARGESDPGASCEIPARQLQRGQLRALHRTVREAEHAASAWRPTKTLLVSTGAEAVENAIKIARQATKRQGVLCFTDAFHGRTMMAMTLTSKVGYKPDCGPFAPEVYRTQFPNFYRYGAGRSEADFVKAELHRLEELSHNTVAPENLAAIIMEVVQGEGGFNVAPAAYLKGLRAFCDKHGILLILDEIQSGFGRTGAWSAYEQFGVVPDISTWAKSLGSGMPIAAVMGKADHGQGWSQQHRRHLHRQPGELRCGIGHAQVHGGDRHQRERQHVGEVIRKRFEKMKAKHKQHRRCARLRCHDGHRVREEQRPACNPMPTPAPP
jgi:4-aminobutyrate aminotransferase/(S)-3-amino-2-methylpropionate transaminase